MANTNFGGVQISDGQSVPTSLQPNNYGDVSHFNAGNISTGTTKLERVMGRAGTIVDVRAYAETAPVTTSIIIDVMKNGVTLFTTSGNRPTIAAAGNASTTTLPDILTFAKGDRLRFDVIQVGTGTTGADVAMAVTFKTPHVA